MQAYRLSSGEEDIPECIVAVLMVPIFITTNLMVYIQKSQLITDTLGKWGHHFTPSQYRRQSRNYLSCIIYIYIDGDPGTTLDYNGTTFSQSPE